MAAGIQTVGPKRPMPERAVVIGATGMVGRSWLGLLTAHGVPFTACARPAVDLLEPPTLDAVEIPPGALVVLAAAWTDVDGAESREADATTANAAAVARLADRCARLSATLVTYSTDYVFDGKGVRPYVVDDPVAPLNAYGRSKAAGEAALRRHGADHVLIRTSWVYAPWGKNFVRTIARLAGEKPEIKVVDDQRGRPTSAEELARTSLSLYLAGAAGVWHATDGGETTWHGLACRVVDRTGSPCRVLACTSAEFPRPAVRPAYSTLDLSATVALIGPRTDWAIAVDRVIERL